MSKTVIGIDKHGYDYVEIQPSEDSLLILEKDYINGDLHTTIADLIATGHKITGVVNTPENGIVYTKI